MTYNLILIFKNRKIKKKKTSEIFLNDEKWWFKNVLKFHYIIKFSHKKDFIFCCSIELVEYWIMVGNVLKPLSITQDFFGISRLEKFSQPIFSYRLSLLLKGEISHICTFFFLLRKYWYLTWKITVLVQTLFLKNK